MIITRINSGVIPVKKENTIECIAGEDIPAGTVVIKDTNTLAYCADIYNESHAHRTIGVATHTAYIGNPITIQVVSSLQLKKWNWRFNEPVYCGDYGEPTQTKGNAGFVQMVGIPYAEDQLYIDIEPAVLFDMNPADVILDQDKMYTSRNQAVTFTCTNVGFSQIEWKVHGQNYSIDEIENVGADLYTIHARWPLIGKYSVKARIKDASTGIWSRWSAPSYVEIM